MHARAGCPQLRGLVHEVCPVRGQAVGRGNHVREDLPLEHVQLHKGQPEGCEVSVCVCVRACMRACVYMCMLACVC